MRRDLPNDDDYQIDVCLKEVVNLMQILRLNVHSIYIPIWVMPNLQHVLEPEYDDVKQQLQRRHDDEDVNAVGFRV